MTPFRPRLIVADGVFLVALVAVSVVGLTDYQRELLARPWEGFGTIVPVTAVAALRVWVCWGVATMVIGGALARIEPRLSRLDAGLMGALGLWIFAWLGGQLLGPVGLYRSWTVWSLLAVGGVWVWWHPPARRAVSLQAGHWLVMLAGVLVLPGLLLVQLGSPVPPYMDVLATPAAAQRIVTFGRYLPFDGDPYGFWGPASQLPGLELFYALLALGGGTTYAVLADTGAIVPMAGLLLLTTYRLGRSVGGDLLGGMATLMLTATMFFRVLPYMHGRVVSFVLVGAGLAFLLERRRTTTHLIVGALALGTAVATHAVYGALGLAVASGSVAGWLLCGELRAGVLGVGLLAGASLVALPTVAINLQLPVPYPTLPAAQLVGLLLIAACARPLSRLDVDDRTYWPRLLLGALVALALLWQPPALMGLDQPRKLPLLIYLGGVGLAFMSVTDRQGRLRVGPVAFAVALGLAIEYGAGRWHATFEDPELRLAVFDVFHKMEYWYPYVLVLPAAHVAASLCRRAPRAALYVVLALLMIPWRDRLDPNTPPNVNADPNYYQHSIVEGWVYQAEVAKRGYWTSTRDRRWTQSSAQLAASAVLRGEVEAGRITQATHVVHVSAYRTLYGDTFWFSVFTGINDDSYLTDHTFNISDAGSRLRPIEEIHARLDERPPYLAIQGEPSTTLSAEILAEYETIFDDDDVRVLRHRSSLGLARG